MRTYQAILGTLALALLIVFPNSALSKPSVSLDVQVQGGGSVTSVPAGINCPDQCAAQFAKTTEVTLTATASNGNEFVGWSGACTGSNNSCVIKLVKDATTTVTFALINLLPNAVDDNVTTDENVAINGNVLTNDYQGNAPATVTAYDAFSVQGGSIVVAANGSFSYTPMIDYFGPDSFGYTITDSNGDSDSATVNITVNEVPDSIPPAPVAQTGQVLCYAVNGTEIPCAGTGQDGETNKGVAWPVPRFTINGDGTVTDELTGLIWLRRIDCFYEHGSNTPIDWSDALSAVANLEHGQCELTDGSSAGDWRLPNTREYLSLADYQFQYPAIPNTLGTGQFENGDPFICVSCVPDTLIQLTSYWTSTTDIRDPIRACIFGVSDGTVGCGGDKSTTFGLGAGAWAVRDP